MTASSFSSSILAGGSLFQVVAPPASSTKMVRDYADKLGSITGAHALRATAALEPEANISKIQQ